MAKKSKKVAKRKPVVLKRRGKRNNGRPRAFVDPVARKRLIEALKQGLPIERSCDHSGVCESTIHRLKAKHDELRVKAEKESLEAHGTERYWWDFIPDESAGENWTLKDEAEFCSTIKAAVAEFHFRCVSRIERPGKTPWQAFMTKLERRDPENWGKKEQFNIGGVNGDGGIPLVVYIPDNGRGPKSEKEGKKI